MVLVFLMLASTYVFSQSEPLSAYAGGVKRYLRGDANTRSLLTVDYAHHEMHEGSFFRAFYQVDAATGDSVMVVVTTPDTVIHAHMRAVFSFEGQGNIKILENPTEVNDGTSITPLNANRNSSSTSIMTVVHTPTDYDYTGATVLENRVLGSKTSEGGDANFEHEWILKANETYVFMIVNESAQDSECNIILNWYEHASLE